MSLQAAEMAKEVYCIDIESQRVPAALKDMNNIHFKLMDAGCMEFSDGMFDTVAAWNAVAHLEYLPCIITESMRVLKEKGTFLVCSTWKIDKAVIKKELLPYLQEQHYKFTVNTGKIDVIIINKE